MSYEQAFGAELNFIKEIKAPVDGQNPIDQNLGQLEVTVEKALVL